MTDHDLPAPLDEIAEIAGIATALKLSAARAGTSVYIPTPSRLSDDHWLVELAGKPAAMAISERFLGDRLSIPLAGHGVRGQSWRVLRKALESGATIGQAARLAGVTDRTVRRHRNGHCGKSLSDERQEKLL